MKTKELKNIAKQIAKQELIIRNSTDAKEIRKAQDAIMDLSGRVEKLEDMVAIDEFVQEILEKI
jgi:glycerol-3-phosphate cytidylyltransferase-like family protein